MAIWYWDPVGGNNANDGTTFANRKLTLQSLITVAAGDEVRCMASPAPVSTAINATWTDGSNTVTLASAVTQVIASCDTNWTASTNVTCATNTTRKEGTNSQLTTIAAGFTTGKAAYFATGTLDCSGYQQLTFWMKQTSGTLAVAGDYTLSLCSDTTGVTQVNNFAIPAIAALTAWFPVTINLATNLGASIQSIALYVNVDRGAAVFQFDNINVALASSAPAAITCNSLISKNTGTEAWFGIRSIVGTTVILDSGPQYTLNLTGVEPLYSGTTETATLYRRETSKTAMAPTQSTYVNNYAGATGTSVAGVTISGGWNTTDMTTQTGQTYLDGTTGYGYGLAFTSAGSTISYVTFSNINVCRYDVGFYASSQSSSSINNIIIVDSINNNNILGISLGYFKNGSLAITNVVKNGSTSISGGISSTVPANSRFTLLINNLNSNFGHGMYSTGYIYASTFTITNANRNMFAGILLVGPVSNTITISNAAYNSTADRYGQIQLEGISYVVGALPQNNTNAHDNIINVGNISGTGTTNSGIFLGSGANNNKIIMTGVFTGFIAPASYPCIVSANAGSNYFTSSVASFAGQAWVYLVGGGKLYISSADITTPSYATMAVQDGQIIFKSVFGVQGQNYIAPGTFWGLN